MSQYQVQFAVPKLSPVIKALLIANVAIWFGLVIVIQKFLLGQDLIFDWFGLVPAHAVFEFWIWQPFTYMFLHSENIFHILFNMLILWMFGSELEQRWGAKFFLTYYLVCGVGAALIYLFGVGIYLMLTGNAMPFGIPVIGASGAVFGLILAYGLVFGERVIYFMMIFPMKAKYFALIIGCVELFTLLNQGMTGQVANLAHLGGLLSGLIFLLVYNMWKGRKVRTATKKHGRRLKLVVNNEGKQKKNGPKYWN